MDEELQQFFEAIWGEEKGYAYLAFKPASKVQVVWRQEFYKWPEEKERLIRKVLDQSGRADVYFGPALYRTRNATKDSVIGTRVYWVDFDGNAPNPDSISPSPSIRIKSSVDGHEHWYWRSEVLCTDIQEVERINRNLAYNYSADFSGWDINQVLRPPSTFNHKRERGTTLVQLSNTVFSSSDFSFESEAPLPVELSDEFQLHEVDEVLSKYQFKAPLHLLFTKGVENGKRSEGLMRLGYELCELGLSNEEVLTLLVDADGRWGKFSKRTDQLKMLTQILSIARAKYPTGEVEQVFNRLAVFGFTDLINSPEAEIVWVWDGLLMENGFMMLTGMPKVGKSSFTLDFMAKAVLEQQFLDRPCRSDLKLGYLSLEMGKAELKYFMDNQSKGYSEEQLKVLNEQVLLIPVGEPYHLNRKQEQDDLEELINEYQLDGLVIDSMGSVIEGDLTSEHDVKMVMDWNDRVRRRHDCFTWFIHHHRKASGDNKKPNKLADVYGSYLLTARATSILTLWDSGQQNTITCIPNGTRLSEKVSPFLLYRDGNLHFTTKKSGVTVVKKGQEVEVLEVPDDEEFGKGKLVY